MAHRIIQLAPEISGQKLVLNDHKIMTNLSIQRLDGWAMFPALAIPLERKLDFECPTQHLDVLKKCIPQVRKLLVIGWRATDTPFLHLLKGLPPHLKVYIVCGNLPEAQAVAKRLEKVLKDAVCKPDHVGFTDFLGNRHAERFLNE